MKLFVFEPYKWDYCGGAIGVIAKDFKRAVKLIVESGENIKMDDDDDEVLDNPYKPEYFSETKNKFKKESFNQWLLTKTIKVVDYNEQVLFDNWNYA